MICWSTRNAMREQKQKIEISLLDLRKFVGVDRFLIIDTVLATKTLIIGKPLSRIPGYTTFHPSLFKAFRWWGASFFPHQFFARILLHERLEKATFQLSSTIRRQDFCSLWTGSLFEERVKPFGLPSPRDFFTLFPNRESVQKLRLLGQVTLKLTSFPVPPLFLKW